MWRASTFSAGEVVCTGFICGVAAGAFSKTFDFRVIAPVNFTDLRIEALARSSAEVSPEGVLSGVRIDSLRLVGPPVTVGGLTLNHIFAIGADTSGGSMSCVNGSCWQRVDSERRVAPAVSLPYLDFTLAISGENGGPGNITLSMLVTGSFQVTGPGPIGQPEVIPLPAAGWMFAGGLSLFCSRLRRRQPWRGAPS